MKVNITIPTFTATWVDGDPKEAYMAEATWDLLLDIPTPIGLGYVSGTEPEEGANLVASVDLREDGRYYWWVCGLADQLRGIRQGNCATLEDARAEVHKRLGVDGETTS